MFKNFKPTVKDWECYQVKMQIPFMEIISPPPKPGKEPKCKKQCNFGEALR